MQTSQDIAPHLLAHTWFRWYSSQIEQYNRAQRMGEIYGPSNSSPDGKVYENLEELDLQAEVYKQIINAFKASLLVDGGEE